jgi:hypothetical protein
MLLKLKVLSKQTADVVLFEKRWLPAGRARRKNRDEVHTRVRLRTRCKLVITDASLDRKGGGEVEGGGESEEAFLEKPHEVFPFQGLEATGEGAGGD